MGPFTNNEQYGTGYEDLENQNAKKKRRGEDQRRHVTIY